MILQYKDFAVSVYKRGRGVILFAENFAKEERGGVKDAREFANMPHKEENVFIAIIMVCISFQSFLYLHKDHINHLKMADFFGCISLLIYFFL